MPSHTRAICIAAAALALLWCRLNPLGGFIALALGALLGASPLWLAFWLRQDRRKRGRGRVVPLLRLSQPRAAGAPPARRSPAGSAASRGEAPLHPKITGDFAETVDRLLTNIINNFVLKWYHDLVPAAYSAEPDTYASPAFPAAVECIIRHAAKEVFRRLDDVDITSVLLRRLLPELTEHFRAFHEASVKTKGPQKYGGFSLNGDEDIQLAHAYAAIRQKPLHSAINAPSLDTSNQEQAHLRLLFGRILPLLLPPAEARSKVVLAMAKEIVACAVMGPVTELLSDPDFYNRIVEEKVGSLISEDRMAGQLREVVKKQTPRHALASSAGGRKASKVFVSTSPQKEFDAFCRDVAGCESLLALRSYRYDVNMAARRTSKALTRRPATSLDQLYLRRLQQALEVVDKRIASLGGEVETSGVPQALPADVDIRATLETILRDRGSPALSHLIEFMEGRHRSRPLQFWLAVDGLTDPLQNLGAPYGDSATPLDHDRNVAGEDLQYIAMQYLAADRDVANLGLRRAEVQPFLDALASGPEGVTGGPRGVGARAALLAMHNRVFENLLSEDFPVFLESDLFLRVAGSLPLTGPASPPPPVLPHPPERPVVPRPERALSHDSTPFSWSSVAQQAKDPPRSGSPSVLWRPGARVQRTSTAAPQVTLQAAFDARPAGQRLTSSRSSVPAPRPMHQGISSSLEILMSPGDGERPPLFGDEPQPVSPGGARTEVAPELDDVTTLALEEALSSIVSDQYDPPAPPREEASQAAEVGAGEALRRAPRKLRDSVSVVSAPSQGRRSLFGDNEDEEDMSRSAVEEEKLLSDSGIFGQRSSSVASSAQADMELTKLAAQRSALQALLGQAELTGNHPKLRIITKALDRVEAEIRELEYQKVQLGAEESQRLVPGRTGLSVREGPLGESKGTHFVNYIVEAQRLADDGTKASRWVVLRRYSEFNALQARLAEKYPVARNLEFPGKSLVPGLSRAFHQERLQGLDRYMKNLLRFPILVQSAELFQFLSSSSVGLTVPSFLSELSQHAAQLPGRGLMKTFVKSLVNGLDTMVPPSMLASPAAASQHENPPPPPPLLTSDDLLSASLYSEPSPTNDNLEISASISEFCATVFDLDNMDLLSGVLRSLPNWIMTENRLRTAMSTLGSRESLHHIASQLEQALWADGQLKPRAPPRLPAAKNATRAAAFERLDQYLRDWSSTLLGMILKPFNVRKGAIRSLAVVQSRRLNLHLIYVVMDEILYTLFPEARAAAAS